MDSGMDIPEYTAASKNFNPMRPLSPEEVCWILDRLTAAEVTNGRSLNLRSLTFYIL
jgi:Mak10 subunit, NatC N(alpha)-terminal acetyltransferase